MLTQLMSLAASVVSGTASSDERADIDESALSFAVHTHLSALLRFRDPITLNSMATHSMSGFENAANATQHTTDVFEEGEIAVDRPLIAGTVSDPSYTESQAQGPQPAPARTREQRQNKKKERRIRLAASQPYINPHKNVLSVHANDVLS
ncbi:uncharacterized protein FIBRA_07440 [Fibroporia radiculosa]|uniref:Uncharacterized protein n=1 Tax=Fibroporia radiculosa TaxID=599839 RepID=J4GUZ9_9APHY|nr:uncharacterized protein FIBRA_07440 [Fibroporia radiculosa]CCM05230.1 predicted protein [Fibroporia radiculosa]